MWIVENAECKNITEIIYKRIIYIYMLFAGWEVTVFRHTDRPIAGKSHIYFLNLTKFFPKEPE